MFLQVAIREKENQQFASLMDKNIKKKILEGLEYSYPCFERNQQVRHMASQLSKTTKSLNFQLILSQVSHHVENEGNLVPIMIRKLVFYIFYRMKDSSRVKSTGGTEGLEQTTGQESPLSQHLLQRFMSYMTQMRNNFLREGVKNIYGRHYAVMATPEFQFQEQWERYTRREFEENNYYELIQAETPLGYLYTAFFLSLLVGLLWFYSSFRVLGLGKDGLTETVLSVSILATLLDILLKFHLKYIKTAQVVEWWQVLMTFRESIVLLVYYSINLFVSEMVIDKKKMPIMYLLDLIALCLLFRRSRGLYRHFKIRSYTTPYKNHFKLFDLFSNIIAIEHIFALTVYLVSFYDSDRNWLVHYGQPNVDNLQRYFYSFYFTSTTIFTIGYGDIVPVNNMEVLCVLAMQMLGIAVFSFLINQIGFTLSSIRKEEQQLQQSISTLSKMCKYYNIDQDLKNLAKQHLLNNQKTFQEIEPQQQTRVLMKLNEDLRESLVQENRINIIKSSLFFICHWSKSMQTEVAKRLTKKILAPNQLAAKDRIFIIRSGKLEVYTNTCFGYRRHFKKLLKTIQPAKPISDNVYGYTAVISGRAVKLEAVSKDFTTVYSVDKAGFLQAVYENKQDIEYYFEIRAKLQASRYIEGFQAPAVLNIRQHYRPSEMFIIKRSVHKLGKHKNRRKDYLRHDRNATVRCMRVFKSQNDQVPSTAKEIRLTIYDNDEPQIITMRTSVNDVREETTSQITREISQSQSKGELICRGFEMVKQYQKYYKRFNMTSVLERLELSNLMCRDYVEPFQFYESMNDYALNRLRRVAPTKYYKPL